MKKLLSLVIAAVLTFAVGVQAQTAFPLFQPSNGVMVGDQNTYVTTSAASADIISLWSGTCNATTFFRADGSCQIPAGGVTGLANPTATLGLTAINGSATTAMRSDAAPALSQAIAPTWTNTHTFANNGANAAFVGNDPRFLISESDGSVDEKNWLVRAVANQFNIATATDASPFSALNSALTISRVGTSVGNITFSVQSGGTTSAVVGNALAGFANINGLTAGQLLSSESNPSLYVNETDAATDEKLWRLNGAAGDLVWSTRTDTNGGGATFMTTTRTGTTVDAINLTATAINLNGVAASDYARLSQSNTFTNSTQQISATAGPRLVLRDSDAAADTQCFFALSQSGQFDLYASTDASCTSTAGGESALQVTRTGAVLNDIRFPNGTVRVTTTDSPALTSSLANVTSRSATTDVTASFQWTGSGAPDSSLSFTRATASTAAPTLFLNKARGSVGALGAVASADVLGRLLFSGYDSANFTNGAEINAEVDGTPGAGDMPGRLVFSTTADGATTPTERLRIGNAGQWGLAGANFGNSGQRLTSNGGSSPPTWQSVGANPTATIGLTAVNGTAETAIRSDGAPALSQAIAPTWTGTHTFTPTGGATFFNGGASGSHVITALGNSGAAARDIFIAGHTGVSNGFTVVSNGAALTANMAGALTVNGTSVCLSSGVNCPAGLVETSGTLTPALTTGCTTTPAINLRWVKIGNTVTITQTNTPTCTSNSSTTAIVAATLPASITPANSQCVALIGATDNGTGTIAAVQVRSDGGLNWGEGIGTSCSALGWTASGTKTLNPWAGSYVLN